MANATVTLIGDRIYAINQTISGVNSSRYFPQNFADSGLHPLLVGVPGAFTREPNLPFLEDGGDRVWSLVLIVEAWMAGIPSETAQRDAEALIETVRDAYLSRPLLRLNGADLDGVIRSEIGDDTGIIPFPDMPELCMVRFPLTVETYKSFTIATT